MAQELVSNFSEIVRSKDLTISVWILWDAIWIGVLPFGTQAFGF